MSTGVATNPDTVLATSIRASDLRMTFDGVEVIHGLDITVEPGTIVGLIGPSGCGKTTTVRMMTGLLEPSGGEVVIGTTPAVELTSGQRSRLGYLPQTPALFPDLSLIENLSFHASMYGLPFRRRRRLREVLEWVELWDDRSKRVSQASGGMQRRLALAAAFVHDPDLIFLDEPTAGLDPILRDKLWGRFREVADAGKTMVVTTQYVGEAGRCDLVGLLSDGELLLLDTPDNLRRAAFDGEVVDVTTVRPLSPDERHRLGAFDFVIGGVDELGPNTYRIVVDDAVSALLDLNRAFDALGVELVEASEHEVDYDEAFVRVVERHRAVDDAGRLDAEADTGDDAREESREHEPLTGVGDAETREGADHGHERTRAVSRPAWAVVIRSFAFLRKEVVEIVRQPKLVALLVVGPFVVLVLFGFGYSDTVVRKRAVFVGPEGSVYEEAIATYERDLSDFIDSQGLVADEATGRALLADDKTDVVVVFPDDAVEQITNGEQATIQVIHDEIDPIQQGTVEVAARLAIQEVNATVLAALANEAESAIPDSMAAAERLRQLTDALVSDPAGTRDALQAELETTETALAGSMTVLDRLEVEDERISKLGNARDDLAAVNQQLAAVSDSTTVDELESLVESLDGLAVTLDEAAVLDPDVLVRPFRSETAALVEGRINPTEYFTPSSLVLLLQHLALTFAALSLVRDRRTGLFELMRVGPLSSIEIIIGKVFAYLLVGAVVAAVLIAASVMLLSVPLAGSIGWLALVVIGVLLASLSLGMVLAIGALTESQAVQYSMLALLGGLFFSGFILPIDGLNPFVRIVSYLLPVTYGVDAAQDIMLRGVLPERAMMLGLLALVVGYGTVAMLGLRGQLRAGGTA